MHGATSAPPSKESGVVKAAMCLNCTGTFSGLMYKIRMGRIKYAFHIAQWDAHIYANAFQQLEVTVYYVTDLTIDI